MSKAALFSAKNLLLLGGLVLSTAACSPNGIPVLGLDDKGELIERYASDEQFKDELTKATSQVTESTFSALQTAAQDQSGTLRTVVVGLGFNLSGGLGPVVTVGVAPKVRFAFSNSQKPIIP